MAVAVMLWKVVDAVADDVGDYDDVVVVGNDASSSPEIL